VVPILRSIARGCNIAFRYPVYKVLKAIAKIFLLNEIEAIFFAYMIRETKWDVKDKLITQNSEQVRDVVCIASDLPEYKNLILYLMVATYSVKFFLNELADIEKLLEEASRICPNFRLIFENWAKKHSHLTKRISLKTLNSVYQELHFKIRHEDPDFNLLVDSILQISPAYNPEKNTKEKKFEKKESRDPMPRETLPREQPTKMVKT
jgi:ubiquinone/menaquinone biosynthesis C-methylase UbiE